MNEITEKNLPKCPVETTMLFLKDRDNILLLGYILLGVLESDELKKMTKMPESTYQITLDTLFRNGFIIYESGILPTELGRSLKPIILAMANWGEKYKTQQKI